METKKVYPRTRPVSLKALMDNGDVCLYFNKEDGSKDFIQDGYFIEIPFQFTNSDNEWMKVIKKGDSFFGEFENKSVRLLSSFNNVYVACSKVADITGII